MYYTGDNSEISIPDTLEFKIHAFHYYCQDFFGIFFMDPGSNTRVPSAGPALTVQPAPRPLAISDSLNKYFSAIFLKGRTFRITCSSDKDFFLGFIFPILLIFLFRS